MITGLPRSRTAWFAAYLTCGDVMCYHDATYSKQELTGYSHVGTADTGYVLRPEWAKELGEHKLVIIHRDYKEVAESMAEFGYADEHGLFPMAAKMLHELNGLHVSFYDINSRIEEIHHYLKIPYHKERADLFINMNIQAQEWSK